MVCKVKLVESRALLEPRVIVSLSRPRRTAQKWWIYFVFFFPVATIPLQMEASPDPHDEVALVSAAQSGRRDAFGKLVDRHKNGVMIFLSVRMQNTSEAEDLAQETFITAWRRLAEFDGRSPLGPWLRGIAHNLLRNHWRKHRPEAMGGSEELSALVESGFADPVALSGVNDDALAALRHCLSHLETSSQTLVRQRYEEGTSIEALASSTSRKASALTMHLHRIRSTLRTCIEKQLSASCG